MVCTAHPANNYEDNIFAVKGKINIKNGLPAHLINGSPLRIHHPSSKIDIRAAQNSVLREILRNFFRFLGVIFELLS